MCNVREIKNCITICPLSHGSWKSYLVHGLGLNLERSTWLIQCDIHLGLGAEGKQGKQNANTI